MEQVKPRLILIGLDGATFDVIRPLVEQGRLPNLGRLMREGAHGVLQSIIPPITGPAWSVLATGQNPGRLGVYDFMNRRQVDDFRLYPIRSQDLAGRTFWDTLSALGYRVGILNYPMLVPAYPINGWMVAGLGASKLHDFAFPTTLKQELDQATGGYEITVSYGLPRYKDNLPLLIEDLQQLLARRLRALHYLLSREPVDMLVAVFTLPDIASHTFWEYWAADEATLDTIPQGREMRAAYIALWEAVDQAVGQVLEYLAPDGHVLVVSDHGFGPSYGVFHVNQWLRQAGYLTRTTNSTPLSNRVREWLVKQATPVFGSLIRRLNGTRAQQLLRASILREIDLERSRAFALDSSDGCGGIYINRAFAHRSGVDEETFVRETMVQLTADLLSYAEKTGLEIEVLHADELYHGDKADLAPELLLNVDDYRCSVSYRFEEPVYAKRRHHPMKSGTHRLEGILLAHGPRIEPGQIKGAQLQDIAPTLLHLADASVASIMDGRVLQEMLKAEYAGTLPASGNASELATTEAREAGSEDEEMEIMLQRLADLGYLD